MKPNKTEGIWQLLCIVEVEKNVFVCDINTHSSKCRKQALDNLQNDQKVNTKISKS